MNEEEVKNKIIIPFLNSIGFDSEQLSFEESFNLCLGKRLLPKEDISFNGRLDILVKFNNNPFMLFELKRSDKKLDEKDLKQALSYSKLIEGIVPYTVLTNGVEFKIYNTFTEEEIDETNELDINIKKSMEESLRYRFEALKNIICFSEENLYKVLSKINESELDKLRDNKYIPEIYVQREEVIESFEKYLEDSNTQIFLFKGESGTGKTNEICSLVEKEMKRNIVLFYNSCYINKPIIENIAEDFNMNFSEQLSSRQIFERIDSIANETNKKIVIFIDAIDELIAFKNPIIEIDNFLDSIKDFSNIKVCFSCRSSYEEMFESIRGVKSNFSIMKKESIELQKFNKNQKEQIIQKYSKFYNVIVEEDTRKRLINDVNNGFLFKIIFQTYNNRMIPKEYEEKLIFEKYIELTSINNSFDTEEFLEILRIIGDMFINAQVDKNRFISIKESELDKKINKSKITLKLKDLYANNILIKSTDKDEVVYLEMYYRPLLYYIITFLCEELQEKKGEELEKSLVKLNNNNETKEALEWFKKYIKDSQYSSILNYKKEYAKHILVEYRNMIERYCPNLKDRFEHGTDINDVGIITDDGKDFLSFSNYSFFVKKNNDDDVKLLDIKENWLEYGTNYRSSSRGKITSKKIFIDRLSKIVKNRQLGENDCKNILKEEILDFIMKNPLMFGYSKDICKNFFPNYNELLPVDLILLKNKALQYMAKILYEPNENQITKEKYIEKVIKQEIKLPEVKISCSNMYLSCMLQVIEYYCKKYGNSIDELPWKIPKVINENYTSNWISDIVIEKFSLDELERYIKDVVRKSVNEYIIFIENNFQGIKDMFKIYSYMKNGIIIDFLLLKDQDGKFGKYSSHIQYRDNSKENKLIINYEYREEKWNNQFLNDSDEFIWKTAGGLDKYFFHSLEASNSGQNKYFVIKNLIYNYLEGDFNKIEEYFKNEN